MLQTLTTALVLKLRRAGSDIRRVEPELEGAVQILGMSELGSRGLGEGIERCLRRSGETGRLVNLEGTVGGRFFDVDQLEVGHLIVADGTLHILLADDVQSTGETSRA